MEKYLDEITLTKKLISIPSYVGSDYDEKKIGEFLFEYLKQFSWLEVEKQPVKDGRFNIIAKDKYPTKVIFCGHIDTVEPRSGWATNPLEAVIKNGKLFGLGATDMKGNLAALLAALNQVTSTQGLMIFLYIDEEYDFLGMKQFIREYKGEIKPNVIISADGGDLSVGYGCRGLVEISCTVKGKSGHAARPWEGVNAISGSSKAIEKLTNIMATQFKNPDLGYTTCNIAYFQGGLNLGFDEIGNIRLGKQGNNIADYAEFTLDLRTASLDINAKKIISLLNDALKEEQLELVEAKTRHDLGSWISSKDDLKKYLDPIKTELPASYRDIKAGGYIDLQMLWEALNKPPAFMLGAGISSMAHKPNEYVKINNLKKLTKIFVMLIEKLAKGGEIDD